MTIRVVVHVVHDDPDIRDSLRMLSSTFEDKTAKGFVVGEGTRCDCTVLAGSRKIRANVAL